MEILEKYIKFINQELVAVSYPGEPDNLYAPVRYELSLGGKRIRPVLMLMACEMFGTDYHRAKAPAVGLEMFHNFTLLHDDVMDNADVRRGKPTVHKVWNENTAVLSGDAMQIMAYMHMTEAPDFCRKEVLDIFSKTALEICEGQQYDMEFESRDDVTEDEYINMIRLKTAVLLGAALEIGAMIAEAHPADAARLYQFGVNIGLAFQLKDDYLDVYGDSAVFGKNIGGDILNNKKTYMLINALRLSEGKDREELLSWISAKEYNPEEKIRCVTDIYTRSGIKELCEGKMQEYYEKGIALLKGINVEPIYMEPLLELSAMLMEREN